MISGMNPSLPPAAVEQALSFLDTLRLVVENGDTVRDALEVIKAERVAAEAAKTDADVALARAAVIISDAAVEQAAAKSAREQAAAAHAGVDQENAALSDRRQAHEADVERLKMERDAHAADVAAMADERASFAAYRAVDSRDAELRQAGLNAERRQLDADSADLERRESELSARVAKLNAIMASAGA